jgi:carbon-monoxide dehydrogenase medium subunit
MSPFDLRRPRSLKEAISLLDPVDADVRPMGGGTALMLMMKVGVLRPRRLVSLGAMESHHVSIGLTASGELHIGALATLSSLEHSDLVWSAAPAITTTMRRLSNVRVRNVATVGGNLAHADPHMDLPPLLAALGASVMTSGASGERTIPVDSLITGYYETVLERDELIVKLVVPPQAGTRSAYVKVTTRSADDWPALGVAVSLRLEAGMVAACRLFVGAATDRPTRLAAAEAVLTGRVPEAGALRMAGDAAADEVDIIGDDQGSAEYKRELLRVYVGRAVLAAVANDGSMKRPR